MQRRLWSLVLCGASLAGFAGCAHILETRTISSFTESLQKSDFEDLKKSTSPEFQATALRHKEAVDAIKLLNIPAGDVKVVKVDDESPDQKRVLVEVGEKKRKLYIDLIKDEKTNRWVVDDVEFKRRLKPGQVNKTVAEQMDLLLSIQEFLDAWESGKREEILATSTPDLRKALEPLPESGLAKFTAKVTTDLNRKKLKPEVEGHANMALVRLPRKVGEILLTMRQSDGRWLADDLAVQSRRDGESIPSLRKQAQVMLTAIRFCEAYRKSDKPEIQKLCVTRFYRSNLDGADLSKVPLPDIDSAKGDVDIKLMMTRAEVLIKHENQIIRLSLTQGPPQRDDEGNAIDDSATSTKPYLVEEVTLHDLAAKQEKRLSALFSSQTVVQEFAKALAERDLKVIHLSATTDFNNRVWKRVELENIGSLPLDAINSTAIQITETRFRGALTEVDVNQGQTPLTYILRDQSGSLLVDDVKAPAMDRPTSLKECLEVVIPLQAFTEALASRNMTVVRANSSREFNKLVFQSMERIPKLKVEPSPFLQVPVSSILLKTDRAMLVLGSDRYGAKVHMKKEGDHYVVDDIMMIGGIEQSQRTGLRQALRQLVVGGTQIGATQPRQTSSRKEQLDDGETLETELIIPTDLRTESPNEDELLMR
ncbi:MAG: hypothetical protein JWN70_1992 [Planctomycetaceae bacterium]|nr:hypothetical protein [Planctomycetaceae bacterium]